MHRYISTDNGVQCFRCGIVLDYTASDANDDGTDSRDMELENAAYSLAFGLCHDPSTLADARAHHYVLEGIPSGADHPYNPLGCPLPTDYTPDAGMTYYCANHVPYALGDEIGYRLVCAYDSVTVGPDTLPADVDPTCSGG